jgi:serine/threonine-protein kinase
MRDPSDGAEEDGTAGLRGNGRGEASEDPENLGKFSPPDRARSHEKTSLRKPLPSVMARRKDSRSVSLVRFPSPPGIGGFLLSPARQIVDDDAVSGPRDTSMEYVPGSFVDIGYARAVVGEIVGDGGMGTVYRGWLYYAPTGPAAGTAPHEVAIKVLHPSLSGKAHVRRLFLGEAEALQRLHHPNIVQIYGLGERAGQLALVIELVVGEALDDVIARVANRAMPGDMPALPFMRAWHYFQQLLGALAATHALGIVHRDVKPANVLIRRDGFVKLTDYGIARLPSDAPRTSGGLQAGTGAYMSPEQVLGSPLDGRSDLYSAAIVLYEMLTSRTPFDQEGRNELMIRAAQLEERPSPISHWLPEAPAVLDSLFARALAKNADDRFRSAVELGDAFRNALRLPDSAGWQAQQALAKDARQMAEPAARASQPSSLETVADAPTGGVVPAGRGNTQPLPVLDAEKLRKAVTSAYRVGQG